MKLIIISGRSGSGKSIGLRALEDIGYYVTDNLPWVLLPQLLEELKPKEKHIAVSLDSRNLPNNPQLLASTLQQAINMDKSIEIIYFDADDNTLLKRFSETRRKHPLTSHTISLKEAIEKERVLLEPVANRANLLVDTSSMTSHDLTHLIRERIATKDPNTLSILFQSFGFKYGTPVDADFIFDVRCLPNPYWEHDLRPLTGLDQPVVSFLKQHPAVNEMQASITTFLEKWLPTFKADRRSYLTVAIGCTGGKHRSVYLVEQLANTFRQYYKAVQVRHKELGKSSVSSS